jgi:serpin B
MRTAVAMVSWGLMVACSACRGVPPEPPQPIQPEPVDESQHAGPRPAQAEQQADTKAAAPPEPLDPDHMSALATAGNAFGLDLYRRVSSGPGNLVFSPMSISLAFAMTYAGARGDTAGEMRRVLRVGADDDVLHASAGQLLAVWNDSERQAFELRVVNRLFGERAYVFERDFVDLLRDTYRAPLEAVDFRTDAEAQRRRINGWVAEQTRDRIEDLLPRGSLDALTRLVLVNAVYFLGQWEHAFERSATADAPFHLLEGGARTVPMMQQVRFHRYAEVGGVQVLEMPYRGDDLAMTVVLPRAKKGLRSLEKGLTAARVSRWIGALDERRVRVILPRFQIHDSRIDLGEVLPAMGMRLAFDAEHADFSGMARPANPDEELHISDAYHEAFVKVDEEGTEAAAATAVVMGARGGPPPAPPEFRADRPFLFMIRDVASGAILFMGRVVDPG